jgi:hypothetical protein
VVVVVLAVLVMLAWGWVGRTDGHVVTERRTPKYVNFKTLQHRLWLRFCAEFMCVVRPASVQSRASFLKY